MIYEISVRIISPLHQLLLLLFDGEQSTSICYMYHFVGLSPDLQSMEQIRRIMRPTDVPDTG